MTAATCSASPATKAARHRRTRFRFWSNAIPDGKPARSFPGIAWLVERNSGRKTATHFSWNCSEG
ncbi:hypothetical protein FJ471_21175 [Mesorhizobium sp. B2-7-1]|nr:hypothetical protein FJ471_21175 [Mesorhizobium sp. B2-7-1]